MVVAFVPDFVMFQHFESEGCVPFPETAQRKMFRRDMLLKADATVFSCVLPNLTAAILCHLLNMGKKKKYEKQPETAMFEKKKNEIL